MDFSVSVPQIITTLLECTKDLKQHPITGKYVPTEVAGTPIPPTATQHS